jgi:hypothetical protein
MEQIAILSIFLRESIGFSGRNHPAAVIAIGHQTLDKPWLVSSSIADSSFQRNFVEKDSPIIAQSICFFPLLVQALT